MAKQILDYRPRFYLTEEESSIILRTADTDVIRKYHGCSSYNPTLKHLNFEILPSGRPVPVINKSLVQRINDNLKYRGVSNLKIEEGSSRKTMALFHFSGSTERMRKMAFAQEIVDYQSDADYSNLTRNRLFWSWAYDLHRFLAWRYGKKNIVAMIAHLDVALPNVEAIVMAVGGNNKISYNAQFAGADKFEYRARTISTHDELFEQVNWKYGLERGERKSVSYGHMYSMTPGMIEILEKAKNDSQVEIDKKNIQLSDLNESVFVAEKRLKSLSTMLSNLEKKKATLQAELNDNVRIYNNEKIQRKRVLTGEIARLEEKMLERCKQIKTAEESVKDIKEKRDAAQKKYEELLSNRKKREELVRLCVQTLQNMIKTSLICLEEEVSEWEDICASLKLNYGNREILQTIINNARSKFNDIKKI